jgi:uncharacterized membrane protein YbhN (UPF0104 family)
MTTAAVDAPTRRARLHLRRWIIGLLSLLVVGALANLLGWNISGWLGDVWDTITTIEVQYLIGGIVLTTLKTGLTAYAWYSILHFAYPGVVWRQILACYATSVAMNSILPANIGTFALLLMFTGIIAGATFTGILGAYAVEKIFYTLIGAFVYLYLFLSVGGSFDISFSWVKENPWATAVLLLGGAGLIAVGVRALWPKVVKWWENAKAGGAILGHPRTYLLRVFLPSLLSWFAMLGVNAVFLAAYDIPVSFHTLMRICGGNSVANVTSVTPGGAGVNQAFNVASLKGVTDSSTATAYSVAQQLVTTAWNIVFAIAMLVLVFGWSGGKQLVSESYTGAKEKAAEQKAARAAKRAAES